MHSDCLQELALRSTSFIAVFLSVEIERRLDSRMTQDSLHGLRFDLGLVHQPVAKRVTKVVKSEPLTILNLHPSFLRSRPEMIRYKYGRGQWDATARLKGRKDKVRILLVRRLGAPLLQMTRQDGMQGNVAVRCLCLGFTIFAVCPAF